jgi:hypothetical protein
LILRINEDFLVSFWQIFETIHAYIDRKKSSRNDFWCKAMLSLR